MTHTELQSLTDSGHDLTAKVAIAIIAAANVGPSTLEMQVDNTTLGMIARTLGIGVNKSTWEFSFFDQYHVKMSFMEVDVLIYARVPR
jgi:hypothetical protein